jgi:peptidoglycan hydrolase-like protein with peptidoglycan-binding domain
MGLPGVCGTGTMKGMPRVRLLAGAVMAAGMLVMGTPQHAAATSSNVAALQAALKSIGLYPAAVDGVRGPLTSRGVRLFQSRRGLAVDGIAGPNTRRALGRRGRPPLGSRILQRGHSGWDVAALQFLLLRRG